MVPIDDELDRQVERNATTRECETSPDHRATRFRILTTLRYHSAFPREAAAGWGAVVTTFEQLVNYTSHESP